MLAITSRIDISENSLRDRGRVLDILLSDRTTGKNLLWATESYAVRGKDYAPKMQIQRAQVIGVNGTLIQPRAAKPRKEQIARTKGKAEVFTPLSVVKQMNMALNKESSNWPTTAETWQDYIKELRLEITCGEAPFIAGRYNPTANTGVIIKPENRVGFLDYKLQTVNKFVTTQEEWLTYTDIALKSSYGYEWQGDNLLIARENVLQTVDDFYQAKFGGSNKLSTEQLEEFAEIIAWNIFQMDGLKYVIPMSCKKMRQAPADVAIDQLSLFPDEEIKGQLVECEGCRTNNPHKHTGRKVLVMDWETGKQLYFSELHNANSF